MIPEYKNLVIKDITARLSYGVKFECNENVYTAKGLDLIVTDEGNWEYAVTAKGIAPIEIDFIKPYLFPLSSMTEEQKKECPVELSIINAFINGNIYLFEDEELTSEDIIELFDFLNKNHFDYRCLIEKGLGIDATGLNIY